MNIRDLNEVMTGKTIKSIEAGPTPDSVVINIEGGGLCFDERSWISGSNVVLHYRGGMSTNGGEDWPLTGVPSPDKYRNLRPETLEEL